MYILHTGMIDVTDQDLPGDEMWHSSVQPHSNLGMKATQIVLHYPSIHFVHNFMS